MHAPRQVCQQSFHPRNLGLQLLHLVEKLHLLGCELAGNCQRVLLPCLRQKAERCTRGGQVSTDVCWPHMSCMWVAHGQAVFTAAVPESRLQHGLDASQVVVCVCTLPQSVVQPRAQRCDRAVKLRSQRPELAVVGLEADFELLYLLHDVGSGGLVGALAAADAPGTAGSSGERAAVGGRGWRRQERRATPPCSRWP